MKPNSGMSQRGQYIIWLVVFVFCITTVLAAMYFLRAPNPREYGPSDVDIEKDKQHSVSYLQSVVKNEPEPLQEKFLQSVRNGVNDRYTKADAYFITHRYLDNGGNIYELYDYVNRNPELAFLKEAEAFKPMIFDMVRKGELPKTYNGYSLHAYLAYIEALDKHGYADVAGRATAANQYAKTAWTARAQPEAFPAGYNIEKHIKYMDDYALLFAEKAKDDVAAILEGRLTENDLLPHSMVVAVNQQASALRYFQDQGIEFQSTNTPEQMFAYSRDYSRLRVPWLHMFTCFLDASTIRLVSPEKTVEIARALKPVYESNVDQTGTVSNDVLLKIINSKSEVTSNFPGTDVPDLHLDIYGKRNVVSLAMIVPEFKVWLMNHGWQESDFEIQHKEWKAGL